MYGLFISQCKKLWIQIWIFPPKQISHRKHSADWEPANWETNVVSNWVGLVKVFSKFVCFNLLFLVFSFVFYRDNIKTDFNQMNDNLYKKSIQNALQKIATDKWPFYYHVWPFFCHLYVCPSQNWGSDSHFEVLNKPKS